MDASTVTVIDSVAGVVSEATAGSAMSGSASTGAMSATSGVCTASIASAIIWSTGSMAAAVSSWSALASCVGSCSTDSWCSRAAAA